MRLSEEHVREVCKLGQGAECCRYLVCGADGFECHSSGPLKRMLDKKASSMTAQSINCKGVDNNEDIKEEN